jgi:hypothetical protein
MVLRKSGRVGRRRLFNRKPGLFIKIGLLFFRIGGFNPPDLIRRYYWWILSGIPSFGAALVIDNQLLLQGIRHLECYFFEINP